VCICEVLLRIKTHCKMYNMLLISKHEGSVFYRIISMYVVKKHFDGLVATNS